MLTCIWIAARLWLQYARRASHMRTPAWMVMAALRAQPQWRRAWQVAEQVVCV